MYGRDVRLQFWNGAVGADSDAGKPGSLGRRADGDNHGLCSVEKYHAVRDVPDAVKSAGCSRDGRGAWRAHSDALYAGGHCTVGAGIAYGSCGK